MIKKVSFENVVGIERFANTEFFPGITIILGKNDVCKTSLLKALYASVKAVGVYARQAEHGVEKPMEQILASSLAGVYGHTKNGIGDIVRKNGAAHRLSCSVSFDANSPFENLEFSFGQDARTELKKSNVIVTTNPNAAACANAIFIPAKEVLTAFPAIKAIVNQYFYPGYDDTTMDLIRLLDIPAMVTSPTEWMEVIADVNKMFSGELKQVAGAERFVYKKGTQEFPMSMTAEGVKHIGVLNMLIQNGQLTKNSILFLDEPEDNLHPSAVRQLMKVLMVLSQAGVQVFMTTHNYFALKQLQIEARRYQQSVMCCSLSRTERGVVEPTFSDLLEQMPDNDIVSESLDMFDEDIDMDMKYNA